MRSAAYGRIRESFDFFFVPYRLLWNGYHSFFTDGKNIVSNFNRSSTVISSENLPYFTPSMAGGVIKTVYAASLPIVKVNEQGITYPDPLPPSDNIGNSFYGPCRAQDMRRLLQYLGYGKVLDFGHDSSYNDKSVVLSQVNDRDNDPLSALPLFAYHKIYYDFYRNTQWENNQPHTWFFDDHQYGDSKLLVIDVPQHDYVNSPHLFDLHYCNYEKDKYLGVLPNSQLGNPSAVQTADLFSGSSVTGRPLGYTQNSQGIGQVISGVSGSGITSVASDVTLASVFDFNILALRQASALQKFKEISQFAPMDYKHQVQAHYGFSIDEGRSNLVQYLGGTSSLVEINAVLNQNLASDSDEASIQGKGDNVGQCDINFTAPEHGIFMVIYHANPLVDYNGDYTMIPENRKYFQTDFPVPEFDSIGMETVLGKDMDIRTGSWSQGARSLLGYAPRYIDFKTRVDRVLGDFTLSRASWVIPLPDRVVKGWQYLPIRWNGGDPPPEAGDHVNYLIEQHYNRFKVSPFDANSIFFLDPKAVYNNYQSDFLQVDASFSCDKVSNLNRSGMPY